jgi:hypothetical protein
MLAIPWIADRVANDTSIGSETQPPSGAPAESVSIQTDSPGAEPVSASGSAEAEAETDSPLDNDNFMSFEDWKKKILAKAGQSPENVGQGRSAPEAGNRRRPVNVNALDSLGEDAEIEIDFGGFVNTESGTNPVRNSREVHESSSDSEGGQDAEHKPDPSSFVLSKDAGKTCKERFNYASFDCAATILKTNSEAKSSTSVLVENKDSYMLNECSAQNKYLIVELCDDILVDTVVLANYEFFSSMFRHFRVSVSDRYPPASKTGWRVLGTFEGRNSRDLQPFLVSEPQIWARYLRVEFLTHYGNEFYCPVSLLRVHGTTMFEQFKREQEEGRGDDEFVDQNEEIGETQSDTGSPAVMDDVKVNEPPDLPSQAVKYTKFVTEEKGKDENTAESKPTQGSGTSSSTVEPDPHQATGTTQTSPIQSTNSGASVSSSNSSQSVSAASATAHAPASDSTAVSSRIDSKSTRVEQKEDNSTTSASIGSSSAVATPAAASSSNQTVVDPGNAGHKEKSTSIVSRNETSSTPGGASTNNTQSQPQQRVSSHTQSHPPSPTTQESFFKSVHKRLQQLEANSTLSLQYIEEQSRILRDAFIKVEKRQLAKIETFLVHLNNTAIQELKSYKTMYEQLWQSTVLELDNIKERNQRETSELGARLSIIADELVWQKRMAVIQSTLLLLCMGLVLFVRSGHVGSQVDASLAHQIGSKYTRIFDTPPGSPEGNVRRRRGISRMWRSETSATSERSGHLSDGINPSDAETDGLRSPVQIEFSPPTPTTGGTFSDAGHGSSPNQPSPSDLDRSNHSEKYEQDNSSADSADLDEQAEMREQLATQSGPATPRGSRDSRPSWPEVDRTVDVLKAEQDQMPDQTHGMKRDKERRKKRSPLRRVESYDGEEAGDSPADDSGGDVMFAG